MSPESPRGWTISSWTFFPQSPISTQLPAPEVKKTVAEDSAIAGMFRRDGAEHLQTARRDQWKKSVSLTTDIKDIHKIPILSLDGMVTSIEQHLALHQGHIILETGFLFLW